MEAVTGFVDVSMPSAAGASAVDQEVASGAQGNSGSSRGIHVREADNPAQGAINRKRDKEIAERIIAEGTMNSECFTPATIDRSRCLGRVWMEDEDISGGRSLVVKSLTAPVILASCLMEALRAAFRQ